MKKLSVFHTKAIVTNELLMFSIFCEIENKKDLNNKNL